MKILENIKELLILLKQKKVFIRIVKIISLIIIGVIITLCISFSINLGWFNCNYGPAAKIEVKK